MHRKVARLVQWLACFAMLGIMLAASLGCESQASAEKPVVVTVASPAPSCPCGDKCECGSLKEQLAAKDAKLAECEAIAERLQAKADFLTEEVDELANDHTRVKFGDTIEYEGNTWKIGWVKVQKAVSVKSVLKQQPATQSNAYMSPCGPRGCSPVPSGGLFRWR